jgi:hypothetical protein
MSALSGPRKGSAPALSSLMRVFGLPIATYSAANAGIATFTEPKLFAMSSIGANPMQTMSNFFHRSNENLTIDSVCTACFSTIAVGKSSEDLVPHEKEHRCAPLVERQRRDLSSASGVIGFA